MAMQVFLAVCSGFQNPHLTVNTGDRTWEVYALPRHHSASCFRGSMRSAILNFSPAWGPIMHQRQDEPSLQPDEVHVARKFTRKRINLLDHFVSFAALAEVGQLQQSASPPGECLHAAPVHHVGPNWHG